MPELKTEQQRQAQRATIEDWLKSPNFAKSIQKVLPRHIGPDRFVALTMRQINEVPKLRKCTPESVVASMMQAAVLGLEIGVNGEAFLIPYKIQGVMTCQLQIGVWGLNKLAWNSDKIVGVHTAAVYEGDDFEHHEGTDRRIIHEVDDNGRQDPNQLTHVYAIVWTNYNSPQAFLSKVLNRQQIENIRSMSKVPDSPAWTGHYAEMAQAKALKRCLKPAPKSRELALAVGLDDQLDASKRQEFDVDIPVGAPAAEPEQETPAIPESAVAEGGEDVDLPSDTDDPVTAEKARMARELGLES